MGRPGFKPGKGRQTLLGGFDSLFLPPTSMTVVVRGCAFPEDRYYDVRHNVWMKSDEPGIVTLGATAYGVAIALEFLAFIPKPVGTEVERDRAVGLLELSKTIISVRTPVAGTVVAANEEAVKRPNLINKDPYASGWLVKLKVEGWPRATGELLSGDTVAPAFEEAMRLERFDGPAQ